MAKDSMGFSTNHGPSLIKSLENELTKAIQEYHRREDEAQITRLEYDLIRLHTQRGVIRGLAIAIAQIRTPYQLRDNRNKTIARIEKKAMQ